MYPISCILRWYLFLGDSSSGKCYQQTNPTHARYIQLIFDILLYDYCQRIRFHNRCWHFIYLIESLWVNSVVFCAIVPLIWKVMSCDSSLCCLRWNDYSIKMFANLCSNWCIAIQKLDGYLWCFVYTEDSPKRFKRDKRTTQFDIRHLLFYLKKCHSHSVGLKNCNHILIWRHFAKLSSCK